MNFSSVANFFLNPPAYRISTPIIKVSVRHACSAPRGAEETVGNNKNYKNFRKEELGQKTIQQLALAFL